MFPPPQLVETEVFAAVPQNLRKTFVPPERVAAGGGGVQIIFDQALTPFMSGSVLMIATLGQLFCTTACLTSASRMLFAFSRDGAVPGAQYWARLNKARTPVNAVLAVAVLGFLLTLPALWKVNIGTDDAPIYSVTAFFAIVSIGVIGLYLAFAIPIYYRWKVGTGFKQGSWNLGSKWKWMAPIAVIEIQRIVRFLKARGIGVLITDHNVRETLAITNRAYILTEGSILASGPSREMAADPLVRRHYLGQDFRL